MEMIVTILVFVVFAVVSDRLEGRKRKKNLPENNRQPETGKKFPFDFGSSSKKPEIVIPELKGAPPQKTDPFAKEPEAVMIEETPEELNKYQKYLAVRQQQEKELKAAYDQERQKIETHAAAKKSPTDIHANVILNAIAYEQILGRPRAWRQLRHRWHNLDNR